MTHHHTRSVVLVDRMDAVHNVRYVRRNFPSDTEISLHCSDATHVSFTNDDVFFALPCEWHKYNDVLEPCTSHVVFTEERMIF